MNTQDVDDFFAADDIPEPPPESQPAPEQEPPSTKRNGNRKETVPDLTFEAGMPTNTHAEKTILGAVMLDNQALKEISISLEADDYSLDSHRRIWLRMKDLYDAGRPIDIVTLSAELQKHKEVDVVGGISFLASLTEDLPRRPVIDDYVRTVADKSLARKLMCINSACIARAADQSESATQTLDILEAQLVALKDRARILSRRRNPEPFFVGYRTFVATAPTDIKWTVDGIIQREGSGLIIGDSGTSKSLLAFDLAIHMVAGVAWFHHKVPERLKVGLVAREDAPGLSQSRLMRLIEGSSEAVKMFLSGLDLEDWIYINTRSQRETWSLQKDADIQEIIEATKERGIHFLFFDVFRALWEGNENDNQETAKVLAAAKQIEREANCQVCIVHHLSKSDRGTIFDRARGGGINGWKEWGIGITVENPDAQPRDRIRKLHFHTKGGVEADSIYYRIEGYEKKVELVEVDAPTPEYNFRKGKNKKEPAQTQVQMPYKEQEEVPF